MYVVLSEIARSKTGTEMKTTGIKTTNPQRDCGPLKTGHESTGINDKSGHSVPQKTSWITPSGCSHLTSGLSVSLGRTKQSTINMGLRAHKNDDYTVMYHAQE